MGFWFAAVLLSCFLSAAAHAQDLERSPPPDADGTYSLRTAHADLQPAGAPAWSGDVALPHIWDKAYPGRDGRATYRLTLPRVPADGVPRGLYFPRVGNQVEIYVGGDLLAHSGTLGDSRQNAASTPLWVSVPARFLSASATTPLEVRLSTQAVRWGGLTAPRFGAEASLLPQFRERYAWRQWGAVGVLFSLAVTGVLAMGLWRLHRDPVYGYFALGALFGALRHGDRLWEVKPLDWPAWGALMAFCFAMHVLLMGRFGLALMGRDNALIRSCFRAMAVCVAALVLGAFGWGRPELWSVGLALLFVPSLWVYVIAVRESFSTRQPEAIAMAVASLIPIGAGLYDFLWIRLAANSASQSFFLPLVTMPFVLVAGWLIMGRYAQQLRSYQTLSRSLDERVRQREQELQVSYSLLQREHSERATLMERQRIMRDIHDGVGSQLVGLLSLIGKGRASKQQLREHANAALDELRMAVDAMQTVDGDLATVLATLRYRLQPRFEATGIRVDWQVEELPTLHGLTPHMVLQIQRILLEAFTNVLRHAQARFVRVSARHYGDAPAHVVLEISDDGVGLGHSERTVGGLGLGSMRARAQAIGASLEIVSNPVSGTGVCVRLTLPAESGTEPPATPVTALEPPA